MAKKEAERREDAFWKRFEEEERIRREEEIRKREEEKMEAERIEKERQVSLFRLREYHGHFFSKSPSIWPGSSVKFKRGRSKGFESEKRIENALRQNY